MLNLCGSSSSASYQFLVFESSLFQVNFYEKTHQNSLFEGLFYNHKGFELFSKTNFYLPERLRGWKFVRLLPFWFLASTFLVPTPLRAQRERSKSITIQCWVHKRRRDLYELWVICRRSYSNGNPRYTEKFP